MTQSVASKFITKLAPSEVQPSTFDLPTLRAGQDDVQFKPICFIYNNSHKYKSPAKSGQPQ